MKKQSLNQRNNFVAKHMQSYNKPKVMLDRKKQSKLKPKKENTDEYF